MEKEKNEKRQHKSSKHKSEVMRKPLEIIAMRAVSTDPQGSYTGVCKDIYEPPMQDADDL